MGKSNGHPIQAVAVLASLMPRKARVIYGTRGVFATTAAARSWSLAASAVDRAASAAPLSPAVCAAIAASSLVSVGANQVPTFAPQNVSLTLV